MRKVLTVSLALVAAFGIMAAQDKGGKGGGGKGGGKGGFSLPPTIELKIAGVGADGMFPAGNAGGQGKSPAISWSKVPAGTVAFAMLMHDPEPVVNKNASTDVTHWVIYNIPGTATGLPAGVTSGDLPDGTKQGGNITGQPAYFGPGPPAGHGIHHYTFELWALDSKVEIPAGTAPADQRAALIKAMDGHVLGKGYAVTPFENK